MFADLASTLAQVGLPQLMLICAVVVFAAVMRAFTGFGFALTAVPVFSMFMPPSQAVVLSVSLTLAVSLVTLRTFWGKSSLLAMLPLVLFSVVGTAMGAALLLTITAQQFNLGVGMSVILACLVLSRQRPGQREPGPILAAVTGLASGLMNGAFAIPGPPVIVYAMATEPAPERSRALLMTFFLFSALFGLVTFSWAGLVGMSSLWLFMIAFPAMYLGDKLGYFLFHRFGTALYRRVALGVLFTVGVVATGKALL